MAMVFCRGCGKEIHDSAPSCPYCGAPQAVAPYSASSKRILPAALLCFFFGLFGFHRFYVGKIWTGILQLLTGGGFVIWTVVDFVFIITGAFTDKQGNKIDLWT